MKKQKRPKSEKGKPDKDKNKDDEFQKNVSRYDVPEMEVIKGAPAAPKEQPVEKDKPTGHSRVNSRGGVHPCPVES